MRRIIAICLSLLTIFSAYSRVVFADSITESTLEQSSEIDGEAQATLYRYSKKVYIGQPFQELPTSSWILYKTEPYSEYCYRENGCILDHYTLAYHNEITYEFAQYTINSYSWDDNLIIDCEYSCKGYVYNTKYDGSGYDKIFDYNLTIPYEDEYGRTYYEYEKTKYYYQGICDLYDLNIYSEYYYHYYKWDDWSDWSENPIEASDELQVETKPGKRITYNANGGYDAPSSVVVGVDESFTISTDIPVQEGHQFLGWSTSTSGDVEYLPGDTCSVSSTTTLYAVWDFMGMISIDTMPYKTQYTVGESLDTAGLAVLFSRSNGSKEIITEGYTVTGFDSATLGRKTVTVTYEGYNAAFVVSVVDSGFCGGNLVWIYDGEGTLTISGTGSMGNYSSSDVPWYNYRTLITTVVLESGITRIGNYAFYDCDNLTNISIPDSITRIGNNAFENCTNLTNVTIGKAVTSIGDSAFRDCICMTSISIPDRVTSIGNSSFYNCIGLTYITIPDSVTSIGSYAFQDCTMLTDVTIGNGVTSIGSNVFSGCSSLIRMTIPFVGAERVNATSSYQYPFGYLFGTTKYTGGKPTTQEYYGYGSSLITSIYYIPYSLKSVTVTGGYIPYGAFYNCDNLTDSSIGSGVTEIGSKAFYDCDTLTNITIGSNVSKVGSDAFYDCYKLENVYIADMKAWCEIAFANSYANPLWYADYLYLNNNLVTDVIIPDGTTKIGKYAFYYYDNLATVGIPESVTEIGDDAFYSCDNLTDVYYAGTAEQWSQITNTIKNAFVEYNYDLSTLGHTHSYGKWSVVSPSTFTTNGIQKKVCSLCGDTVTEGLDLLVGKVDHWNIVLEDDYAVNFYLQVSESIESTAKVKISIGNETLSYNISALEKTGDGYYKITVNISAAQMNDQVIVIVMNSRDIGSTSAYTAREYCDEILANPEHSAYHDLVREMLNYGAMAQMYFDYDTEYLANDGISGVANAEIPETAEELTVSDKISGVSFYGASLVYRDRIAVRYYFTGVVTGLTFTANGNTYTPIAKDGMYYIEIADILPQNLDQQITLTVTDANGNTLTVTYGPMNYIVRMNEKGSEVLRNLLKALYNYHLAAKAL